MMFCKASALVASIRAEIQRYGQSIVPCDKLLLLVPKNDPIGAQFGHIFKTAEREHWSFEFRSDGTVRFANLEPVKNLWPPQDLSYAAEG